MKHRLIMAASEYDRKQSTRKGHNPYALPQYFQAIDSAMNEFEAGQTIRKSLVSHFNGRLLDILLTTVGEPKSTDQEQRF
jgi:hypothetical protein